MERRRAYSTLHPRIMDGNNNNDDEDRKYLSYTSTGNPLYYAYESPAPVYSELGNEDEYLTDDLGINYYFPSEDDPFVNGLKRENELDNNSKQDYPTPSNVIMYFRRSIKAKKLGAEIPEEGQSVSLCNSRTMREEFSGTVHSINPRRSGATGWVYFSDFTQSNKNHRTYKPHSRQSSLAKHTVYRDEEEEEEIM